MKPFTLSKTIRELFSIYIVFILLFFSSRALLFGLYYDRIIDANVNHWLTFVIGLRMDTIVASIILVFPTLFLMLSPQSIGRAVRLGVRLYLLVFLLLAIYIENATYPFIAEFDVRPNAIFINYLEYPKEVLGNIWASYKAELFGAFMMMLVVGILFWKLSKNAFYPPKNTPYTYRIVAFVLVSALLFLGIRSSLGHRAANISTAVYSSSHLLNEITKNSLYAIGYAYYSQKRHGAKIERYGAMNLDEAYARVSRVLNIPLGSREHPFFRKRITPFKSEHPKNLVIFLQESLGAQFVGALGGEKGITPNIDRLSHEAIFFDQLYSNGTRSIRGIAGSVAGFLPVPGEGVLKRNKSQQDFFTVAQLLKPYGYHSSFIYGGMSNFDNMRSWFLGNGFERLIDQPEFENPAFLGVWGVCDEDLVKRANQEFSTYHQKGESFVSVLFSTTNHTPFEYPKGRIEPIASEPENGVKNAVKFADYAIGTLIADAKKAGYYDDTVFMILSDHNVRTFGNDLVPVSMYHIMGMILGGGITPQHVTRLATQPDVLATALDALGLDLEYPILGTSIFEDPNKDTILMQFHDMYALRKGNSVAVIQPGVNAQTFTFENQLLHPTAHNKALEKDATAFVHVLNDMYENQRFNMGPQ